MNLTHCVSKKTGKPIPFRYIGGDDYVCPECCINIRFCKSCLDLIPMKTPGQIIGKFYYDGINLRYLCDHHASSLSELREGNGV